MTLNTIFDNEFQANLHLFLTFPFCSLYRYLSKHEHKTGIGEFLWPWQVQDIYWLIIRKNVKN